MQKSWCNQVKHASEQRKKRTEQQVPHGAEEISRRSYLTRSPTGTVFCKIAFMSTTVSVVYVPKRRPRSLNKRGKSALESDSMDLPEGHSNLPSLNDEETSVS